MKLELICDDAHVLKNISGVNNENIRLIEELYKTEISLTGNTLCFNDDEELKVKLEKIFNLLIDVAKLDIHIKPRDINYINNINPINAITEGKL